MFDKHWGGFYRKHILALFEISDLEMCSLIFSQNISATKKVTYYDTVHKIHLNMDCFHQFLYILAFEKVNCERVQFI